MIYSKLEEYIYIYPSVNMSYIHLPKIAFVRKQNQSCLETLRNSITNWKALEINICKVKICIV